MIAKVTRGNQVTIPKEIVLKLHIKQGNDYVDISMSNGMIVMKPVDVEERIPDEVYERFIKKALKVEPGDVVLTEKGAENFLKKRMKK